MKDYRFPTSVPVAGRVRVCLELLKKQSLKDKHIIDIGSSFGWLEKETQEWGYKEIIGIEPSASAVDFAKKNVKGIKFIQSDAANLPVSEKYAEIALLFDVIEHVPVMTENIVFDEINRVLKKGGLLLLSTPNTNFFANLLDPAWYLGHRHYSAEHITRLLKKSGFQVTELNIRGSILSSLYLFWFYLMKRIMNISQPRSSILEKLDDLGYNNSSVTDIFLVAKKI